MTNGMQEGAAVKAIEQPTPERFFNALNAHQQTEAMKTAVELDVFTSIAEGNTSPAAIAERCKAAERGVRILCDFLTIHGFLTKENVRRFASHSTSFSLIKWISSGRARP